MMLLFVPGGELHKKACEAARKIPGIDKPTMQEEIDQYQFDNLIDKLVPGYSLGDMNYSNVLQELSSELGKYKIKGSVSLCCETGADLIKGMVQRWSKESFTYTNKLLVVLEPPQTFSNNTWLVKAGWSYDGHTLGIVAFELTK